MERPAEDVAHLLDLAAPQEAVVDEDAAHLLANRLAEERRHHGGVDATRERADDLRVLRDLAADLLHLVIEERAHGPRRREAGDVEQEGLEDLDAARRVSDLGVELQA